jgi:hypothetical protein
MFRSFGTMLYADPTVNVLGQNIQLDSDILVSPQLFALLHIQHITNHIIYKKGNVDNTRTEVPSWDERTEKVIKRTI